MALFLKINFKEYGKLRITLKSVQNAIQKVAHFVLSAPLRWIVIHLVDSVMKPLTNWAQKSFLREKRGDIASLRALQC